MSQTWQPKNFYGSAQPVGKLTDICKTAFTMSGSLIAPDSRCDKLSKKYRCSCTNGKSTAGRMNQVKCLPPEMTVVLSLISSTEKTDHARVELVHIKSTRGGK